MSHNNDLTNDYAVALKAAGAELLAFGEWGSYQGDWVAHVRYKGREGFVRGWYGSCSGCDAFQAEMGWDDTEPDYQERLVAFGANYLEELHTKEELLAEFVPQAQWDMDADKIVAWLNAR